MLSTRSDNICTSLCILVDAAALSPSTLKKAFVIATIILFRSNEVTIPFLLMTLYLPGMGDTLELAIGLDGSSWFSDSSPEVSSFIVIILIIIIRMN